MENNRSYLKKLFFSLIVLLAIFFLVETVSRYYYFQKSSATALASVVLYKNISKKYSKYIAARKVRNMYFNSQVFQEQLFKKPGQELLKEYQHEYEEHFKILVEETKKINSILILLYIPTDTYGDTLGRIDSICRNFYQNLADRYNIEMIDVTEEFLKHKTIEITLRPRDNHLSRFGNIIVAQTIAKQIFKFSDQRANFIFPNRPKIFGEFGVNYSEVWDIDPAMSYRVISNSNGLRMNYDVKFPKEKQRILVLGDSFTFGPYLSNYHLYTYFLEMFGHDIEVINAGIDGYTISDELSLFNDKAKYVEPDITIVQVLDNDIWGFFFRIRNLFDRKGIVYSPSESEEEFLKIISGFDVHDIKKKKKK